MGSYNYRKLTSKLKKMGFRLYRQGKGSHALWVNDQTQKVIPVPNHGSRDIRSGTLQAIAKQMGLKNVKQLDGI